MLKKDAPGRFSANVDKKYAFLVEMLIIMVDAGLRMTMASGIGLNKTEEM